MSRAALILAAAVGLALSLGPGGPGLGPALAGAASPDPHVDPSLLPLGCIGCHEGHGVSGSPMLPAAQKSVCLACHGTRSGLDGQVSQGRVAPHADPPLLDAALARAFVHPMDDQGFSRHQEGSVTCTSCHSPHRGMPEGAGGGPTGRRKVSPRDPTELEVELCISCHGGGPVALAPGDVGRLVDPGNRSYHPLEAPTAERSPTVLPTLSGREVNCTDCHGNSDPGGPRGPHGSAVRYLLEAAYITADGAAESPASYTLCYRCHTREAVLERSLFPEHRVHVAEEKVSCATCHDPHGSVENRSLIRFGGGVPAPGVAPSARTGRLDFISTSPGSGACYLTCHGVDHAPETYGGMVVEPAFGGPDGDGLRSLPPSPREPGLRPLPPPRRGPLERPPARPPGAAGEPTPGTSP